MGRGRFTMGAVRPRHYVVFFLFLYILLECITIGGSISPQTRGVYVAKLTYVAGDNTEYFYSNTISQLNVRVGYFSSCIQTKTPSNTGSWKCGRNESMLLSNDANFNASSPPDQDLYNFFENTAVMFRQQCMTPYILVVAILISFVSIFLFAFQLPDTGFNYYKYSSIVCYLAFSLSLVAAVWQETNTLTGTKLMKVMVDDYYSLSTQYGTSARAMIWIGVVLTFFASASLFTMSLAGSMTNAYYDA